jgi:hypothetical protein
VLHYTQEKLIGLYDSGYSAMDIIGTLFKVVKFYEMPEEKKLEYIKVGQRLQA